MAKRKIIVWLGLAGLGALAVWGFMKKGKEEETPQDFNFPFPIIPLPENKTPVPEKTAKSCNKGICEGTGMAGFDQCNTNQDCFQPSFNLVDLWGAYQGDGNVSIIATVRNNSNFSRKYKIRIFNGEGQEMYMDVYNVSKTPITLQPIDIPAGSEKIFFATNQHKKTITPASIFKGQFKVVVEEYGIGGNWWKQVDSSPLRKLL